MWRKYLKCIYTPYGANENKNVILSGQQTVVLFDAGTERNNKITADKWRRAGLGKGKLK